ncbi:MAG: AAA family ATPase [bacterium]|nr:AAA family ATPase [bacterium]
MIESFTVKNFRCFKNTLIEPLARVNLIGGSNNVGKTALLEALLLHCGLTNPVLTTKINFIRGLQMIPSDPESLWGALFYKFDAKEKIELSSRDPEKKLVSLYLRLGENESGSVKLRMQDEDRPDKYEAISLWGNQMLHLEYNASSGQSHKAHAWIEGQYLHFEPKLPVSPLCPGFFLASQSRNSLKEEAEHFGKIEMAGQQESVLRILQLIEPRLRRLSVIVSSSSEPIVHGDIGIGRLLPLPLMGEGMGRILSLAAAIFSATKGIVLIDEVENGLHHKVMVKVWKAIAALAREFDTQIFATTHNEECIRAAHQAFEEEGPYELLFHRLDRIDDNIRVVTCDQEMLAAAINIGIDIR